MRPGNVHRGQRQEARIPAALRSRHCYLAGASGTGKSTLLLNMILQDITAGCGVGLLDPHGDLVNAVLKRIPKDRVNDVILFDPSDESYPFALNIRDAKDDTERERIVNETVMALERYPVVLGAAAGTHLDLHDPHCTPFRPLSTSSQKRGEAAQRLLVRQRHVHNLLETSEY